jgi:hypothetical protein
MIQGLLLMALTCGSGLATSCSPDYWYPCTVDDEPSPVSISRDVVIYGGGVSGSHAASLLRDRGKSVAVIEQDNRLGGAAHAYHNPVNKQNSNYGVQLLGNTSEVKRLYAQYGVPLAEVNVTAFTQYPQIYADFATGQAVKVVEYETNATDQAQEALGQLLEQYAYLNETYDIPSPVPADLTLSVNALIQKYNMEPLTQHFNQYFQGYPELKNLKSLYLLKFLSGAETTLVNKNHDNGEVFRRIRDRLGPDVFLNSTILKTQRQQNGQSVVWIQTPRGRVEIKTKKILVTVPPVLENMKAFDLNDREEYIFRQFRSMNAWTGLVQHMNISPGTGIVNTGKDAPYNEIALPGSQGFVPTTDPTLHSFVYSSYEYRDEEVTKKAVFGEIDRLQASGVLNRTVGAQAEIVAMKLHGNYALSVSKEQIKGGFYNKLYALQGYRDTVYGGAAFTTQGTADVFDYNQKYVMPLLADI